MRSGVTMSLSSFNPRLPLPGGDAAKEKSQSEIDAVSIHASRCREAMPVTLYLRLLFALFQSTPPVAGRRCAVRLG